MSGKWAFVRHGTLERVGIAAAHKILAQAGRDVEALARETCPVRESVGSRVTGGFLRDSIEHHFTAAGSMVVYAHAPYARYVHNGTAAHPIDAVNHPVLWFFWTKKGVQFKGEHVDHPGAKAQPWLREALQEVMRRLS